MKCSRQSGRSGFTLLELTVSWVVALVVVGLSLPALDRSREAANRETCQNNLKMIGVALNNYASANGATSGGFFPPLLDSQPINGWMPFWFSLYPYFEEDALYRRSVNSGGGWGANNHSTPVKSLLCPSDATHENGLCSSGAKGWAGTSYAPVAPLVASINVFSADAGVNITKAKYTFGNLPDGTAHQIAIVERLSSFPKYGCSNAILYPMSWSSWGINGNGSLYGAAGLFTPQTEVSSAAGARAHPYSPTTGHATCQVLMVDGSVRGVAKTVNKTTWANACTPDDGNILGDF